MTAVAMINRKGGVGKTTLCIALADILTSTFRKRILLIDLDPQANLTLAAIGSERWEKVDRAKLTLADAFLSAVQGQAAAPHIEVTHRVRGGEPVSIIASTPRLSDVEAEAMESDQAWRRRVGSPYLVVHQLLASKLDLYDYVLIDCPPSLGVITLNGLAISDGFLMPVMPSAVSMAGLNQLVDKAEAFAKSLARPIRRFGTVVNRFEAGANAHLNALRELRANRAISPVWDAIIRKSVRAEEGFDNPRPLTLTQRWGTLYPDLHAMAEEFIRRVR
jgi:chromosome partitioning protein